jgi:phosphoserine phosphatase
MHKTLPLNEMPRSGMRKLIVAFDVDGTLLNNDDQLGGSPNYRVVRMLMDLAHSKNVRIVVWSGGGEDYARQWGRKFGLDPYVWKYAVKDPNLKPDICFDDIQECALGKVNVIVREK